MSFIVVVSRDFRHIRLSGYERDVLHFLRSMAGYLSGPGDALSVSSSITISRSDGVQDISESRNPKLF